MKRETAEVVARIFAVLAFAWLAAGATVFLTIAFGLIAEVLHRFRHPQNQNTRNGR